MFRLRDAERLALRHGVHHDHELVASGSRAWKQELEKIFEQDAEDQVVDTKKAPF